MPITMPAIAPPEIGELESESEFDSGFGLEFESESEPPFEGDAFAGSALSVSDHELSQSGGFFAGVSVVSV
jgi:hypothetical protein